MDKTNITTGDKVLVVLLVIVALAVLVISSIRSKNVMAIDYCWDSNDNHYVAPNEMCNH